MSKEIPLTQNKVTIVDDADYEWLSQYHWQAFDNRGMGWYARRRMVTPDGKSTGSRMHREILGVTKGSFVDHRNGDGLDNRRINLRICTRAENNQNAHLRTDNASGYKGVYWHKHTKKWYAHMRVDGKLIHLGIYRTPTEAAIAYDEAARKVHGEFARVNFPIGQEAQA